MNDHDGRAVAENAMDAIAIAGERCPGCRLVAVQTLLVVRAEDGSIRIFGVATDGQHG